MTDTAAAQSSRKMLTVRPNASRQLLARKAVEKSALLLPADCVESSFPGSSTVALHITPSAASNEASTTADSPHEITQPSTSPLVNDAGQIASTWSDEDEAAFKALALRRKAAHYPPRGRDVAAQVISVGNLKPNSGTVVSVIVGLVAERGTVARDALLAAMASATFPHAKARPTDPSWCQGYIAGAIRSGFLRTCEAAEPTLHDQTV